MSSRLGRDQSSSRRDNHHHHHNHRPYHRSSSSSRFDEPKSSSSSRAGNISNRQSQPQPQPPSRHLWVGNLSHNISQSILTDHFIRFGELENIIYHPGRSYAFVNFQREDDAIAAFESPQGCNLQGLPLRIEFAKSDKSSAPSRDEMHLHDRDEYPTSRSSAYSPRESRKHNASPDAYFPDTSRANERSSDRPTEILWIGFPSFLKVDDSILRKAFSPFGDIEKITAFPGRTYAFVQFRNVSSARRAKETLQGKLFGNPRVHISFAKKDHASSTTGRRNMEPKDSPSPYFKSTSHAGSSDYLRSDRNIRESTKDPSDRASYFPGMEFGAPDIMSFSRKESSWTHSGLYEDRRFHERGLGVGPPEEVQEYRGSPFRDRSVRFNDFSPPKFQRTSPFQEDQWDLPEDSYSYHGAKKLKINSFSHENELPEYPLHNSEQDKQFLPGFGPELRASDQLRAPLPHRRQVDNSSSYNRSLGDGNDDNWRSSHDTFQSPLANSLAMPVELKRTTPEFHQPRQKEWKWEGTIAKGGTPVCRARCFPVGKVMDIFLPEFLDCTARTGLDMLAKHYYQAACSWVVFFVAASDADMGYYNEFMHYLGDKQRAAVAKLDDRNTLFLVPPSDFAQNVLKVPGKLSISGVVLSLEPCSPGLSPRLPANETKDQNFMYSHENNTSYSKMELPSGSSSIPLPPFTSLENSGVNYNAPSQGTTKTSTSSLFLGHGHASGNIPYHMESRHDLQPGHPVSQDSALHALSQVSEGINYNTSISGRGGPELTRVNYDGSTSYSGGGTNLLSVQDYKFQSSVPLHMGGLQQEQHADVPSSLHVPQRQTTNNVPPPHSEAYKASGLIGNQAEILSRVPPGYIAQTNQGASQSLFSQQMVQSENGQALFSHGAPGTNQGHGLGQGQGQGQAGNQEIVNMSNAAQDDSEGDPQKRLQATLQLAAALLHQIQGKGT